MIEETGFHDVKGIPICVGDLIRVKHFRHYRRKQQIWLYFLVGKLSERFVVHSVFPSDETHRCLLQSCSVKTAEVLDGTSYRNKSGDLVMWCERERKKGNQ